MKYFLIYINRPVNNLKKKIYNDQLHSIMKSDAMQKSYIHS